MTDRRHWLTHPVQAWRAFAAHIDAQADADAIAAGLTVEHMPAGVRRYHNPRLDQLAAHRAQPATPDNPQAPTAAGPVEAAGAWSTPTLTGGGVAAMTAATRLVRCLDCAAQLHRDEVTGALVDRWGQAMCGASCRAHAPDLPVLSAGPAVPASHMPVRLRRAHPSAGAGAVPPPTVPPPGHSGFASVSHATALRAALDPGHPAAAVSDAPAGSREEHAPARPQTGPRNHR
jgi:hypothetical protein